jgi:hypothetical protein
VRLERRQDVRRDADPAVGLLGVALELPLDEQRNVAPALAQRRDAELEHAQPVVEVEPEAPLRDGLLQIAVRRGDDAGAHGDVADAAQALHDALLQDAQQLRLHLETFLGLVPILWATGTGSDVMKRIAAPMVGGIFTSFVLELVVYPPIYQVWRWNFDLKRRLAREAANGEGARQDPAAAA